MALEFDYIIDMTTAEGNTPPSYVGSFCISNEPDNSIYQFYINNSREGDKVAELEAQQYDQIVWADPDVLVTKQLIRKLKVKSFPQLGTMVAYELLHEEKSYLLCPLFVRGDRFERPEFTITQLNNNKLKVTMQRPEDDAYVCWRILLRIGDTAFEYVTYEDECELDPPYLTGTYDCYCVGYVGEGQAVSDDSEHVTLSITGTGLDPLDKFEFYTKTEIDAMLGNIAALLDSINGEVI